MAIEEAGAVLFSSVAGKILLGAGLILVAPVVFPIFRPVTKQVLKTCLVLGDKTQEFVAETYEKWGDVLAEAQAEMAEAAQTELAAISEIP